MSRTLVDIDSDFSAEPGPRLVKKLALKDGGVDPLGLRQINLDLMDKAIPGINNTTVHVRPYSFMAWVWWKTHNILSQSGNRAVDSGEAEDFAMRLEVIYAWSHMLAGGRDLPGMSVLRGCMPMAGGGTFTFAGNAWATVKAKRRASTSIMDPIQYGPSIKALGFLEQTQALRVFKHTENVMGAIRSIDEKVVAVAPAGMFHRGETTFSPEQVMGLAKVLPPSEAGPEEQKAFQALFWPGRDTGNPNFRLRNNTLELLLMTIEACPGGMTIPEVRRALACGLLPNGERVLRNGANDPAQKATWLLMSSLQVRQLQRLALESMLVWIEVMIDRQRGAATTDDLVKLAMKQAAAFDDDLNATTLGDVLARLRDRAGTGGWPAAAGIGKTDFVSLSDQLCDAQRGEDGYDKIPGLTLTAIAYVHSMYLALKREGAEDGRQGELGGRADRFPISLLHCRVTTIGLAGLETFWQELIESWVIGQHVRWSVVRNGDGTQRLRLALGENGWLRVHRNLSGPFEPTRDRLFSALSLAAQCGVVQRDDSDGESRFSAQ